MTEMLEMIEEVELSHYPYSDGYQGEDVSGMLAGTGWTVSEFCALRLNYDSGSERCQ